jgi:predicted Zn-dependent protease
MMFRWKKVLPLLVGLLASGLLVNCATNPVTGEQDLALMSEEKELSLGAKNHPEILKQYGVYDNPVLQAYVNRIGQQLAKHSHRSNLKYTFTVLDSPEVNAFALPGGYIYITRGIMAYINSEAELAAVLGHELGHVTARHGVQQYSKAMATSIGMTLATIFVPELQTDVSQQLMNILGNALLSGYGREHELEADRLGAEYLARTSYEPRAMTDVIGILKNQEEFEKERAQKEGREPRVYHGVFASHPSADTRLQQVVAAADQYKKDGTKPGRINRGAYLAQLDSMVFGDSVVQGIRRNNRFYHEALDFTVTFPEGWRLANEPSAVSATNPARDAAMEMRLVKLKKGERLSPREIMLKKLKLSDVKQEQTLKGSSLPNHSAVARIATPFGRRKARVSVVVYQDKAYAFFGAAKTEKGFAQLDPLFIKTTESMRALKRSERKLAQGLRIKIIRAGRGTSFYGLARSSPIPNYPERLLRLINDRYPKGEPRSGEAVKIIR